METIRAVVFDLYGTLIRIHTEEENLERVWKPLAYYYCYHGAVYDSPAQLFRAYRAQVRRRQRMADERFGSGCGEVALEQVLEALFRKKGARCVTGEMVRGAGMLLRACSTHQAELYPGAPQLLDGLRGAGKKVFLLSNAQRLFTWPEMNMLGLCGRFDLIFLSSDWGVKKPSPDYFALVLQECGCPPRQVMMVGNSIRDDIVPARTLGMRTCFLNTDGLPERPDCDLICQGADYETLWQTILPGAAWFAAR